MELEEEEKLEMERILQLEREITEMHRRSEALASIASDAVSLNTEFLNLTVKCPIVTQIKSAVH